MIKQIVAIIGGVKIIFFSSFILFHEGNPAYTAPLFLDVLLLIFGIQGVRKFDPK